MAVRQAETDLSRNRGALTCEYNWFVDIIRQIRTRPAQRDFPLERQDVILPTDRRTATRRPNDVDNERSFRSQKPCRMPMYAVVRRVGVSEKRVHPKVNEDRKLRRDR